MTGFPLDIASSVVVGNPLRSIFIDPIAVGQTKRLALVAGTGFEPVMSAYETDVLGH
jgi:hypothetical protein